MATIKDVARLSNVSVTTVSNYLNNKKKVGDGPKKRIKEAIEASGYRYNTMAASLKRKDKGIKAIGVITIVDKNPFFSEIFFELEKICFEKGYTLLSSFRREEDENLQGVVDLMSGKVDGLIIISISKKNIDKIIENLHAVPLVALAFNFSDITTVCGGTYFNLNNNLGGYIAGRYLLSKVHKTFACVTGTQGINSIKSRISGFQKAMSEFNIDTNAMDIYEGDFTYQSGVNAMYNIFSSPPLPSAIFCHNDLMAIGVLNACRELGINIPGDISVIGYDGIDLGEISSPTLTTIKIPIKEIVTQAIEGLEIKILNKELSHKAEISVSPSLVVRRSSS